MNQPGEAIFGLLYFGGLLALVVVLGLVIFVPAIVAFRREHPHRWLILALNVFLGGTGIGWVAALIWALNSPRDLHDAGFIRGHEAGMSVRAGNVGRLRIEGTLGSPYGPAEGTAMSTGAAVHELERLERLRAAGHLQEAEFAALKAEVLGRV